METCRTLYKPFLLGIYRDLCDLYSDDLSSCQSKESDIQLIASLQEADILNLCLIGKAVEKSLITGEQLHIEALPIEFSSNTVFEGFYDNETGFPVLLHSCFDRLFWRDGFPVTSFQLSDSLQESDGIWHPATYQKDLIDFLDSEMNRKPYTKPLPGMKLAAMDVLAIRQFYLGLSKLRDITCIADEESEIREFKERVTRPLVLGPNVSNVIRIARRLLDSVFDDPDFALWQQYSEDPWGRHGPGAVFDSSKGKDKWTFGHIPGLPDKLYQAQHASLPQGEVVVERRARLAVVPKDFRGHRLICVEPKELMFYEQGLMSTIYSMVESNLVTRTSIDFRNQSASYKRSRNLKVATIDLSDASDNLRKELCRLLFSKEVFSVLAGARSREVELPDGEIVVPTTMFTMGNALCFPIETLAFWALSLASMLLDDGKTWLIDEPWGLAVYAGKRHLIVFGDDIIVHRRYYEGVVEVLTGCGLLVNKGKSCYNTYVREACGSWWYANYDCSITRLKTSSVETYSDWISTLESAMLLYQSGFFSTCESILSALDAFYPVPYSALGFPYRKTEIRRWNVQLQRLEWRLPFLSKGKPEVLNGEVGLYAYFTGQGSHTAPRSDQSLVEWGWVSLI